MTNNVVESEKAEMIRLVGGQKWSIFGSNIVRNQTLLVAESLQFSFSFSFFFKNDFVLVFRQFSFFASSVASLKMQVVHLK